MGSEDRPEREARRDAQEEPLAVQAVGAPVEQPSEDITPPAAPSATSTPMAPQPEPLPPKDPNAAIPLTELDRLTEVLRLNSKLLVGELSASIERQVDAEDARGATLDAKANALFAANGLATTVAFAFGASTLLGHPEYFGSLGMAGYRVVATVFLAALSFGLASGFCALQALRVRVHKAIDDADLFNEAVLQQADDSDEETGLARYRRYMIAHIWAVNEGNRNLRDKKADLISWGQICFFVFQGGVLLLGLAIAIAAYCTDPTLAAASARPGNLPSPTATSVTKSPADLPSPAATSVATGSAPVPVAAPPPIRVPQPSPMAPASSGALKALPTHP